jgi:hypothetical protein
VFFIYSLYDIPLFIEPYGKSESHNYYRREEITEPWLRIWSDQTPKIGASIWSARRLFSEYTDDRFAVSS